jgi:hypothetical protein
MPDKGTLALRALTEFKLGGRLFHPGQRFSLVHHEAMRLVNAGKAEVIPVRDGRYRRRDMRAEP